jgi:hypothetical protein
MKTLVKSVLLISAFIMVESCSTYTPNYSYGPNHSVSLDVFYSSLSPYGMWVEYPRYGYVWIPNAGVGFRPYYTSGHWVYTDYGWTWYSYYSWGWAPFHYGRWFYDNMYGWAWVPDTTWGPAWVAWSSGNGYCGWAPLRPGVTVGFAVSGELRIPRDRWVFVRESDLTKNRIARYSVNRSRNMELLSSAQLIRHFREKESTAYLPGPDRSRVEKRTGKPVREVPIVEDMKPRKGHLHSNRFENFKQDVNNRHSNTRPRPDKVFDLKDVKEMQRQHPRGRNMEQPRGHFKQHSPRDNNMHRNRSNESGHKKQRGNK